MTPLKYKWEYIITYLLDIIQFLFNLLVNIITLFFNLFLLYSFLTSEEVLILKACRIVKIK